MSRQQPNLRPPGPYPQPSNTSPSVSFTAPQPYRTQTGSSGASTGAPPIPPKMVSQKSSSSAGARSATSPLAEPHELRYAEGTQFSQGGGAGAQGADVRRKKSLVKPDRERIDPNHRLWHYREHAAAAAMGEDVGDPRDGMRGAMDPQARQGAGGQYQQGGGVRGHVGVMPSTTGNAPIHGSAAHPGLRRGKSILAREPSDYANESGLNIFKRGATLRRKHSTATQGGGGGAGGGRGGHGPSATGAGSVRPGDKEEKLGCLGNFAPGPKDAWMVYCYILTICIPGFVLRGVFGKRTPEAQRAWREKMGLVSIVATLMAAVGFLTFGFTEAVCNNSGIRINGGKVDGGSIVVNGYDYDLSTFKHPAAAGYFNGTTNPLYSDQWQAGGKDASFLFQNVNENCLNVITPATGSAITNDGTRLGWYFPCNLHDQYGTSAINKTGYTDATNCHTSSTARSQFYALNAVGEVYYSWEQIRNSTRNLAVYESSVLDLDLLQWLDSTQVKYPAFFDQIKTPNATYQGKDVTMMMYRAGQKQIGKCLQDIVRVGFVDSMSIGCVASDVVLYVSLIFIIGVVLIKFTMAVIFGWFRSWKLGNFKGESYQQRMARAAEIENWTDDIYRPAPSRYRPSVQQGGKGAGGGKDRKGAFLPTTSRFSQAAPMMVSSSRPSTAYGAVDPNSGARGYRARQTSSTYDNKAFNFHTTPPGSPMLRSSRSSTSLPFNRDESRNSLADPNQSNCPFPLHNVIPQPPPDYEPFNFPLVHSICLVTAYSESVEGLRTTLDSLATTDYPNSHKVILVVADGMVKGSGSKLKTPDIVLGMMKDLVVPAQEVEAHSYVAIADGHKRHNMAKVYAGFYDYDNSTVEGSKQQRCPIVLVAKVGNPLEAHDAKPGNRGKRDSQIVLMSFLQKVMFDERMTTFEYEFFNSLWRVTGVSPDRYETVLCVDADTKVFPDSLTRMNACMVNDPEIMGLCGETKIANKSETWVTMIQVFEYYISHHLTKAFESMFGGVTCLPGCFSMYRIKAPKGDSGYWVPILANPDICEHYSENIVDTLHKKNLLLLGEDRFLTTLMLKTFPKRKMVFVPQAVCKTVVPDTFRILLSQRRRWINSTIHNLFELVLVRDLCGTFCFSMQFVVFMELVGTLVLPAAISFTIYILVLAILPTSLVPGHQKPIISLILLAFILGLPGVLIVITSRKVAYVGWMLIYLGSLPIWNLVLPAYAFWHMDDFSWGETRKIEGGDKDKGHGDKDGEFDSSHIVMKRWVEFERERRWKTGTQSRDSYYDVVQRSSSPRSGYMARDRYSMVSTNETYFSGNADPTAPLYRPSQSFASMSNATSSNDHPPTLELPSNAMSGRGQFRGRDDSPGSTDSAHIMDEWNTGVTPSSRSIPSMSIGDDLHRYSQYGASEEDPILPRGMQSNPASPENYSAPQLPPIAGGRSAGGHQRYPEPEYDEALYSPTTSASHERRASKGYSLTDQGAIAGAQPVRRVKKSGSQAGSAIGGHRNSQQSLSQMAGGQMQPGRGMTSPPAQQSSLPPGAAPAQTGRYY